MNVDQNTPNTRTSNNSSHVNNEIGSNIDLEFQPNSYSCMSCVIPASGENGFGVLFDRNRALTWIFDKIVPVSPSTVGNRTSKGDHPSTLLSSRAIPSNIDPLEIEYKDDLEILERGEGFGIFGSVPTYLVVSKVLIVVSVFVTLLFLIWSAFSRYE